MPPRFNVARDVLDPLGSDGDKLALWWIGSGGGPPWVVDVLLEQTERPVVEFSDSLPKTTSGKIKRAELGQREWDSE